jgi:thiol-disulfide isomerase/thioredoxin
MCRIITGGFLVLSLIGGTTSLAAADALPDGMLHLVDGGYVAGRFLDADAPDEIAWQGAQFTAPFQFPLSAVRSVIFRQPGVVPQATGEFCFELATGDVIYGRLVGVSADAVDVDEPKFGPLSLRRGRLRRFFRWNTANEMVYVGPTGLNGWVDPSAPPKWREDGSHLATDQPGAQITGAVKLPAQATVEFELAWTKRPNFALALGAREQLESAANAFRIEIVDSELVALRETRTGADIALITPVGPGEGRVHFLAYLDQQQGRLFVYTITGTLLAELHVGESQPTIGDAVTLINVDGDVRLERLRISRWNGVPPTSTDSTVPRYQQADGELREGSLVGFDADRQVATFRDGDRETEAAITSLEQVVFAPTNDSRPPDAPRNIHLTYHDGTRIGGTLLRAGRATIALTCPEASTQVVAPLEGVRAVSIVSDAPATGERPQQRETLELPNTRIRGRLVDGRDEPDASCLVWQPELSKTASPLRKGVSGQIVYRAPNPPAKPAKGANSNRRPAQAKALDVGKLFQPGQGGGRQPRGLPHCLHLRSGDTIPCEVKGIDERGVTIETSLSEASFVSHEKVKAIELVKSSSSPKLAKAKRERLLTLPRMQRDSPPTQLICSRNGDVLRGRVLELGETELKVEVRLDERRVKRDRVAQIIWLHADELGDARSDAPKTAAPADATPVGTRVQVQRNDGIRLTFFADRLSGETLSGRGEVLGDCRFELAQVDQLLIGAAIEEAASSLTYHRWKLHHAIDPKFVQEENAGDPGEDSPLVGKPAPDFRLEFLDGTKFHLAECAGQVVVLDFWATWCGPCLQVMPQVEQVVGEFGEANVRLVAVNLEESPKQIAATLARHKLNVPVVLDQDGVVAHKYQASAIPQTVVIDREGRVFRVFVGGGPDYADELRDALKAVTQPDGEAKP